MTELVRRESLAENEEAWHKLLPRCTVDAPFLTSHWQRVWLQEFGDGSELLLLFMNGEKGLEAIAPLARRNGQVSFIGDQDVSDYADFLVARGSEDRFYPCLLDHLDREEWHELSLFSLPQESPTLNLLPSLARSRGYQVQVEEEDVAPGVTLPDTWDDYLLMLSKKDRHELRRKLRRLEAAEQGFRWYARSGPSEVEDSLDDFLSLMRHSREEKNRFLTGPRERFFRAMVSELASVGILRLFFMELGVERVAAALCFDYGGGRFLYNSGYNPDYGYYSVGLLLHALCLRDAIEAGKDYFDFLRGSEPYKYDLGGKNRTIYHMVVTRP